VEPEIIILVLAEARLLALVTQHYTHGMCLIAKLAHLHKCMREPVT